MLSPYLNRSLENLENEVWIDIAGFEDLYQISSYGRVKSLPRWVRAGYNQFKTKTRILSTGTERTEVPAVTLCKDGEHVSRTVATLVADAFLGERQDGYEVCHLNKNAQDNRLCNLKILSFSDSERVAWKLGVREDWGIGEMSRKSKTEYEATFCHFENGEITRITCKSCSIEHPISEFYKKEGERRSQICKTCQLARMGISDIGKYHHRAELAKAGLRYCSVCKELKSLDTDFCKSKNRPMGKSNNCKACMKIKNDITNARAKEKRRLTKLAKGKN